MKKGIRSFIALPYKTRGKSMVVARLEGTKLERSGKGNVPKFLVHSGKVMRGKGRTQEKQVIQNICAGFQDGVVEQKAFLPHGQEHDRSVKFSETLHDLYCCLPGFIYCMSVTLFLGINRCRVLLNVPRVLPITEQCSLSENMLLYFFSYSKCRWGRALEAEVSDLLHVGERQGQVLVNIFFCCYSRAVVPAYSFLLDNGNFIQLIFIWQ